MRDLLRFPLLGPLLYKLADWRTDEKIRELNPLIPATAKVLDIGAGNCLVAHKLHRRVTAVDIKNHSFVPTISPILYDGRKLPFKNHSFDIALLITVLHHTPDPEKILREAGRVAKKVIVIEEIYTSNIQRYITFFIDSLFNLEFVGHPHTNKTDNGWKALFIKNRFRLIGACYTRSLFNLLSRATYIISSSVL